MLAVPDGVLEAISGGNVASRTVAVAQYGGRSVPLNVSDDGDFTWDANGDIQCNGSIRAFGESDSLVPKSRDAVLAPYGQEVTVSRLVKLRSGDYTIPVGVFRITHNDGGSERFRMARQTVHVDAPYALHDDLFPVDDRFPIDDVFPGYTTGGPFTYQTEPVRTDVVLSWSVGVDLSDRLRMLQRAQIVNPASPPAGATVYSELQRLSLFPLERNPAVVDQQVPAGTVYENRRNAVSQLAGFAGAKPRVTRQGALTLRPADRWAYETVLDFDIDGVIDLSDEQSDEFYNYVWAHNPDGSVSSFAALYDDTDPRSVGRAGPSTYEHSSPVYTTQLSADVGAQTVLSRLLNRRSRTATVRVGPVGWLLDLSDYGRFTDRATGRTVTGEVAGKRESNDPTADVEVTVIVAENS